MGSAKKCVLILIAVAIVGFSAIYLGKSILTRKAPMPEKPGVLQRFEADSGVQKPAFAGLGTVGGIYLPIYHCDVETMKAEISSFVCFPDTLPLKDKLALLARQMSRISFQGLPIEILSVDNRDGKYIARINLKESDGGGHITWRSGRFQGSSGGGATTLELTESFLQRDYSGEWIDGVEFYYEGKPIRGEEWDHISLDGVITRGKR